MKLVLGGKEPKPESKDPKLIKLVAKAHLLRIELGAEAVDSIKAFATKYKLDHADAKNLIPLAYLAPSIIEDILSGQQPVDLNVKKLKSLAKQLPLSWSEQRELLGFAS